jgi:thiol-disulfide isomerase/thioredoxin
MQKRSLKTILTTLSLVLLGSGIYFGGLNFKHDWQSVNAAGKPEAGKVIEASENYVKPGQNKRMMLMDLGATTCIPCKMMVPVMEELAKKLQGKVDIQFVDIQKRGDLAQKFKIFAIPTQIIFDKNGKELFRHEGFYPKDEILAKLKELGMK